MIVQYLALRRQISRSRSRYRYPVVGSLATVAMIDRIIDERKSAQARAAEPKTLHAPREIGIALAVGIWQVMDVSCGRLPKPDRRGEFTDGRKDQRLSKT